MPCLEERRTTTIPDWKDLPIYLRIYAQHHRHGGRRGVFQRRSGWRNDTTRVAETKIGEGSARNAAFMDVTDPAAESEKPPPATDQLPPPIPEIDPEKSERSIPTPAALTKFVPLPPVEPISCIPIPPALTKFVPLSYIPPHKSRNRRLSSSGRSRSCSRRRRRRSSSTRRRRRSSSSRQSRSRSRSRDRRRRYRRKR